MPSRQIMYRRCCTTGEAKDVWSGWARAQRNKCVVKIHYARARVRPLPKQKTHTQKKRMSHLYTFRAVEVRLGMGADGRRGSDVNHVSHFYFILIIYCLQWGSHSPRPIKVNQANGRDQATHIKMRDPMGEPMRKPMALTQHVHQNGRTNGRIIRRDRSTRIKVGEEMGEPMTETGQLASKWQNQWTWLGNCMRELMLEPLAAEKRQSG